MFRSTTAELEHKIVQLAQMGMPLRALHVQPCCSNTFLSIIPPKTCDDALNASTMAALRLTGYTDACLLRELMRNGTAYLHEYETIRRKCHRKD